MLQNKNYQQQHKLPTTTKTNATKQELPTTTIKKPIVENQTSGKTKTNATKQELPTTTTKLPVTPTKTNATKQDTSNTNNNNKETNCRKSNFW